MIHSPTQAHAHVLISGKVQGVGYRAATCDAALLLKITGWVRNRRDGKVEAVFEGDRANVDEMIRWCHQGPPTAIVQTVKAKYGPTQGFRQFEMTRSI